MTGSGFESRTVQANGQRVHLEIAGSAGPLVLLCHGFPESWYSWRHQLTALATAGYCAVAMDMRGYGRSSKPVELVAYRITELVADCIGVVQALGESTAVIIGHDWGAPVAWTAAWTHPELFQAVAGLSVPFGGRGLMALPGDPFGDIRPSITHRELCGPDSLFYQEYFNLPGHVAERDAETDLRSWLTSVLYSASADSPLPSNMCMPRSGIGSQLPLPDKLPSWLREEDLEFYVAELERSGLTGGLNYYRNIDLNWELLAGYQDRPVTVPSLFIGGDRDIATVWGQEAISRASEKLTDLRGTIIVPNCGHWIQQEQPSATNTALLEFLGCL